MTNPQCYFQVLLDEFLSWCVVLTVFQWLKLKPRFSLQDGVLLGAVGAYDWTGAVLKETKYGKVVPPKSSYQDEFPDELKNHGAYLGNGFVFCGP